MKKSVSLITLLLGLTFAPVAQAEEFSKSAMIDAVTFELNVEITTDLFVAERAIRHDITDELKDKQRMFELTRERLTTSQDLSIKVAMSAANELGQSVNRILGL